MNALQTYSKKWEKEIQNSFVNTKTIIAIVVSGILSPVIGYLTKRALDYIIKELEKR